jgi:putative transposase
MDWIEPGHTDLPLMRQCELAGVPRATVYRRLEAMVRRQHEDQEDNELRALIDKEYTRRPFYGNRRMAVFLRGRRHKINRKRVQRLMRADGAVANGARTGDEQAASAAQGQSIPAARR